MIPHHRESRIRVAFIACAMLLHPVASFAQEGGECVVRPSNGAAESPPKVSETTSDSGSAALLFADDFDGHADWTSGEVEEKGVPQGWFSVRETPAWAPSTGYPDGREAIEILDANADKAIGGSGKSAVFWRESITTGGFANDKILLHRLDERQDKVYVEFMIRFSPTWTVAGLSKIFRVYAWDEENAAAGPYDYGPDGTAGPVYFWDYGTNSYGARNWQALRGGPYGENYFMSTPEDFPWTLKNGSAALNFGNLRVGQAPGGSTASLEDKLNGGSITTERYQVVTHSQVYGEPSQGKWTKLAFYVEMNSAPGAADGKLIQWLDGSRILYSDTVPWLGGSAKGVTSALWNMVAIGGNDDFEYYPDSRRYKDWFAIDDLRVFDDVPSGLSTQP